jgi:hypothetical protein
MTSAMPVVRTLTLEETRTLIGWAKDEGWNPGLDDAEAFHAFDPEGFIGCFVDGELAAAISAVAYGETFGFIGLYICRQNQRGKGYGRLIWNAGMARLANRTIGLDGVPQQQANYRQMGFMPAYETSRWSGRHQQAASSDTDPSIIAVTPEMIGTICDFDRSFFPESRVLFIEQWLKPAHVALAIIRDGDIQGYGVLRPCHQGFKIGPLFCRTDADAQQLFASLAGAINGGELHIDVPQAMSEFSDFLEAQGFKKSFVTARMYRGPIPALQANGIYGITTLELG